jgi:hypothetical protein
MPVQSSWQSKQSQHVSHIGDRSSMSVIADAEQPEACRTLVVPHIGLPQAAGCKQDIVRVTVV